MENTNEPDIFDYIVEAFEIVVVRIVVVIMIVLLHMMLLLILTLLKFPSFATLDPE